MTNQRKIILILGAIIIAVGAYVLFTVDKPKPENPIEESPTEVVRAEPDVIITRTDSGYVPNEVIISKGQTILWTNESGSHHWPASDVHPTHRIYSEFDPRKPIAPGEDWVFTFEQTGEWRFHDHLRANLTGTVIVVE